MDENKREDIEVYHIKRKEMRVPVYYKKAPIIFQNLACTIYGLKEKRKRFGSDFSTYQKLLEETEFYTVDKIAEYQFKKVKYLLVEAQNYVPYYRKLFDEIGFNANFD